MLSNVKPGDKLIVNHHLRQPAIATVERVTNTLVITTDKQRFNKKTGNTTSSDKWTIIFAKPATPDDIEAVKREDKRLKLVREIELSKWSNLSVEQLEQILQILKSSNQNE